MSDDSEWGPYLAEAGAFLDAQKRGVRPRHPDGRPFTDDEVRSYQAANSLVSDILQRHGIIPRKARKRTRS